MCFEFVLSAISWLLEKLVIVLEIHVLIMNFVMMEFVIQILVFSCLFSMFIFCSFCCVLWVCSVSTTMITGEACNCSGNTCADNEFCYDGVCNTNPGIFMFIPNVYFLFLLLCALSLFCQQYHGYWRNL